MGKVKSLSGKLTKFSKGRASEEIPWSLLQDANLSYEAIGLLCQLQSYPSDWDLFKTELYKRNPKNKRTSVERIWNELVENGYIIQYRMRDGSAYSYQYIFSVYKFTDDEFDGIDGVMKSAGYEYYLNDKQLGLNNTPEKTISEVEGNVEAEGNSEKWDVENQQSNENVDKSRIDKNGMLILNSSKTTSISERFYINSFDEEEDIYKLNELAQKPEIQMVIELMLRSGVSQGDTVRIARDMTEDSSLLNPEFILEQLKWCIYKSKHEGIGDFAKYYINGLRTKVSNSRVDLLMTGEDFTTNFAVKLLGEMGSLGVEVPMYDWLNNGT